MFSMSNASKPVIRTLPRFLAGAAAVILCTAPNLMGAVIEAQGSITEVTVFPDRAETVREATVQVPAGASRVEFGSLPWMAERDSFRVSARGVRTTLGAVEIRESAEDPAETGAMKAARAEVERLEQELSVVMSRIETLTSMKEFLDSIRASTAVRESEKLAEGTVSPEAIRAVFDLMKSGMNDLGREKVETTAEHARLGKELKVARAKLQAERPSGPIRHLIAGVDVEAAAAGSLTLRLEYLAPGASWRPAYRASLDAGTGKVDLESEAVVSQRTGEDWAGVALKLSTASPARGVEPPELPSWLLRPPEMRPLGRNSRDMMKMRPMAAEPAAELEDSSVQAEGGFVNISSQVDAVRAGAGIVRSGYNLAFTVPGRSEIPADGNEHRVALRQDELDGEVTYRSAPSANEAAYLVARTKMTAGYPLLAGPVRVFAGSAYLGSFRVEETGPGSELTLPFGIDNRIQVERVRLPESRGKSGIFGRERRAAFGFRTKVTNNRSRKIAIKIEDRIPVSEDDRIKVDLEESTTSGYTMLEDRPGILEWSLELGAGETAEILLEYTVRHPADMPIPDLD